MFRSSGQRPSASGLPWTLGRRIVLGLCRAGVLLVLLGIVSVDTALSVQVDGFAYLEGQESHEGTRVRFRNLGSNQIEDTNTWPTGYFEIWVITGHYEITYSHAGFQSIQLPDVYIPPIFPYHLPDVTLESGCSGPMHGFLGPGDFPVVGRIYVAADDELTILPGTRLLFEGPYPFDIYGSLQAIGESEAPIVFTRQEGNPSLLWGGLAFYSAASTCHLEYCTIEYGGALSCPGCGGGIYCHDTTPALRACTITHNWADVAGGGAYFSFCEPVSLTRCVITDNSVGQYGTGGGVFFDATDGQLTNCTICQNNAESGCAVACVSTYPPPSPHADVVAANTIIWNNNCADPIYVIGLASFAAEYCDIEIEWPGVGNIECDPEFADPANGDYHLTANSCCIDAGDPSGPADPDSTRADIGSFYFHQGVPIGGIVYGVLEPGEMPYLVYSDLTVPYGEELAIEPGAQLQFLGHYRLWVYGQLRAMGTEQDSVIFTVHRSNEDSTWGGIRLNGAAPGCCLQYCRIEHGRAPEAGSAPYGGGIHSLNSHPLVSNCTIRNNMAANRGGGIYFENSDGTIQGCIISQNRVSGMMSAAGGGIFCRGGSPTILGNHISENTGASVYDALGGGVYCLESSPLLSDNIISGNALASSHISTFGGGFCSESTEATLDGNTISGNLADFGGGVFCGALARTLIRSCTVAGNRATSHGGGIYCDDSAMVENTIIWGNCADVAGHDAYLSDPSTVIFLTCCDVDSQRIEGPGQILWLEGNLSCDPLFCYPVPCDSAPTVAGNYCLRTGSPCADDPQCGQIGAWGIDPSCSVEISEDNRWDFLYLSANAPNPFSATTTLEYAVPGDAVGAMVKLRLCDCAGRWVRTLVHNRLSPGRYSVVWDGTDDRGRLVGSGIYFSILDVHGKTARRRLLLLR